MKIPSIVANNSIKLLSGLANNDDSLASMIVKDWMSDGATVYTYKKQGGKDDAREKAIEEFGTGAVWLFGIPTIKKIINKTIYPLFNLNAEFDPRILDNKERVSKITEILNDSKNPILDNQKQVFNSLGETAKKYKGFAIGKFLIATALSAVALTGIIKLKQKTTNERIEKELEKTSKNIKPETPLEKSINQNKNFELFTGKNKNSSISFTGGFAKELAEFMYNPIKNTMILDGVITTTRLKEARKGERFEVGLKEVFQIIFIYCLAKPFQKMFEGIGNKLNCPIELDPKVLFSKDLKEKIKNSKDAMSNLENSKDILEDLTKIDIKNPLIELLDKNGAISTIKKKGSDEILALNFLKPIDDDFVKETIKNIKKLGEKIDNLGNIKKYKTFAVIANVVGVATIMGIFQPMINIWLRKLMHNGDNRNPAIAQQEEKMYEIKMKTNQIHQG